jgi:hypothetical protein
VIFCLLTCSAKRMRGNAPAASSAAGVAPSVAAHCSKNGCSCGSSAVSTECSPATSVAASRHCTTRFSSGSGYGGGGCVCCVVALYITTATSGDGGCGAGGSSSRLTTLAGRRGSNPSKTSTAPINRLASMGLPLPAPPVQRPKQSYVRARKRRLHSWGRMMREGSVRESSVVF